MRISCFLLLAFIFIQFVCFADSKPAIKSVAVNPVSPASGEEMFISYCAACHGRDGRGAGPAVPALKVPPPDLTVLTKNNGGLFPELKVYNSILGDDSMPAHGSRDMPVWGTVFRSLGQGKEDQMRLRLKNLTRFIEVFQR